MISTVNEPAFPNPNDVNVEGMTLRDYFAAKAMQAYLAGVEVIWNDATIACAVERSYAVAQAMLKEREIER